MGEGVEIECKKLEIVKYALDQFYKAGFHVTRMEAAFAAGISKWRIYKYLPSSEGPRGGSASS
jgi:hypothetical protein